MPIEKNVVITKTRIDFYQYVDNNTDWDHDTILKNVSHRVYHVKKRKVLVGLLRQFVKEEYKTLSDEEGVKTVLDDDEYDQIFPPTAGVRPFHIKIVFESKEVLNKMKLKHPVMMSNLKDVQDEIIEPYDLPCSF